MITFNMIQDSNKVVILIILLWPRVMINLHRITRLGIIYIIILH